MSRILGIDYGQKRIGLSLGETGSKMAWPYKVLENKGFNSFAKELKNICRKEKISKIVLGLPLGIKGSIGSQASYILNLGRNLNRNLKIPVEFQDERMSSKEAEKQIKQENMMLKKRKKIKNRKERIDLISAQIILQDYLNKFSK